MNGWTDQLHVGQHAGCGLGLASVAASAGGFEKNCVAFFDMEHRWSVGRHSSPVFIEYGHRV